MRVEEEDTRTIGRVRKRREGSAGERSGATSEHRAVGRMRALRSLPLTATAILVVAVVLVPPIDLLRTLGAGRATAAVEDPEGSGTGPTTGGLVAGSDAPATPVPGSAPGVSGTLPLEEARATWRVSGGTEEAAALAVVVARRRAARDASTPFVVLEAVERPAGDAVVVTVLVDDGRSAPRRFAVPIVLGPQGARLAGEPWELPPPSTEVLVPDTTVVDDARLVESARLALAGIGLVGDELTLVRTTAWPVIARIVDEGTPIEVWLRWHLDRFVVAGLPLDRSGTTGATAEPRP